MTEIECVLSADEQKLFTLYGRYLNLERVIDGFVGGEALLAEYTANCALVGRSLCAAPATSLLCCQIKLEFAKKWNLDNVFGDEPDMGDVALFDAVRSMAKLMPFVAPEFDALCVI